MVVRGHARGSKNFRQGRRVQGNLTKKALTKKSNGQFQRNLSFFKVQKGVRHCPGGGGGSNCLFPIDTHITCDFPGGGGGGGGGPDPLSSLWIRNWGVITGVITLLN